jgi:hypothetical protein
MGIAIRQQHPDLDGGMQIEETGHRRKHVQSPEDDGCGHGDVAAECRVLVGSVAFRVLHIGENTLATREIAAPFIG